MTDLHSRVSHQVDVELGTPAVTHNFVEETNKKAHNPWLGD